MKILVTGGLGFIGSHICVQLLNNNNEVIVLDDLSNSKINVLDKIKKLSNNNITFYQGSVLDKNILDTIFTQNIDIVIHMASYKSVSESIKYPLKYYNNNINGTIALLDIMEKYNCKNLIFSSSATVYGIQDYPVNEECSTGIGITNPYGKTKYMIEEILKDMVNMNIIALRYFNPIGAHKSGLIGEDPNDIPNNLMPYVLNVVTGKLNKLLIYGNNYNTFDGTCIRDFIHVEDLAYGHLLAVNKINELLGFTAINLGTGKGSSVLELVTTFNKINNTNINYEFTNRRIGDLPIVYSDVTKAFKLLNFKTKYSLEDCCKDAYNFITNN
jgi:UDP-glucose 4-epimerase